MHESINRVLRGRTSNKYLEDLTQKEQLIDERLREYWDDPEFLIQLTFFPWIREQWQQIQMPNCRYNM